MLVLRVSINWFNRYPTCLKQGSRSQEIIHVLQLSQLLIHASLMNSHSFVQEISHFRKKQFNICDPQVTQIQSSLKTILKLYPIGIFKITKYKCYLPEFPKIYIRKERKYSHRRRYSGIFTFAFLFNEVQF